VRFSLIFWQASLTFLKDCRRLLWKLVVHLFNAVCQLQGCDYNWFARQISCDCTSRCTLIRIVVLEDFGVVHDRSGGDDWTTTGTAKGVVGLTLRSRLVVGGQNGFPVDKFFLAHLVGVLAITLEGRNYRNATYL